MKNFNFESASSNYLAKLMNSLLIQVRDCKLAMNVLLKNYKNTTNVP